MARQNDSRRQQRRKAIGRLQREAEWTRQNEEAKNRNNYLASLPADTIRAPKHPTLAAVVEAIDEVPGSDFLPFKESAKRYAWGDKPDPVDLVLSATDFIPGMAVPGKLAKQGIKKTTAEKLADYAHLANTEAYGKQWVDDLVAKGEEAQTLLKADEGIDEGEWTDLFTDVYELGKQYKGMSPHELSNLIEWASASDKPWKEAVGDFQQMDLDQKMAITQVGALDFGAQETNPLLNDLIDSFTPVGPNKKFDEWAQQAGNLEKDEEGVWQALMPDDLVDKMDQGIKDAFYNNTGEYPLEVELETLYDKIDNAVGLDHASFLDPDNVYNLGYEAGNTTLAGSFDEDFLKTVNPMLGTDPGTKKFEDFKAAHALKPGSPYANPNGEKSNIDPASYTPTTPMEGLDGYWMFSEYAGGITEGNPYFDAAAEELGPEHAEWAVQTLLDKIGSDSALAALDDYDGAYTLMEGMLTSDQGMFSNKALKNMVYGWEDAAAELDEAAPKEFIEGLKNSGNYEKIMGSNVSLSAENSAASIANKGLANASSTAEKKLADFEEIIGNKGLDKSLGDIQYEFGPGIYGLNAFDFENMVDDIATGDPFIMDDWSSKVNKAYISAKKDEGGPSDQLIQMKGQDTPMPDWYDLSGLSGGVDANEDALRIARDAQNADQETPVGRIKKAQLQGWRPETFYHLTDADSDFIEFEDLGRRGAIYMIDNPDFKAISQAAQTHREEGLRMMPVKVHGRMFGRDKAPEWFADQPSLARTPEGAPRFFGQSDQEELDFLKSQLGPDFSEDNVGDLKKLWRRSVEPNYRWNDEAATYERVRSQDEAFDKFGKYQRPLSWGEWESLDAQGSHPLQDIIGRMGFHGFDSRDEAGISSAIMDPTRIRSVNAKFDPKYHPEGPTPSANLLRGLVLPGAGTAAIMGSLEDFEDDEIDEVYKTL